MRAFRFSTAQAVLSYRGLNYTYIILGFLLIIIVKYTPKPILIIKAPALESFMNFNPPVPLLLMTPEASLGGK